MTPDTECLNLPPPGTAVAILGEALVDQYPDGVAVAGGAPFNVARWLGAFGVPVLFFSRVGAGDEAATLLRAEMQRFGLPQQALQTDPVLPTGLVHVWPDARAGNGGHRFEIAENSAWDALDAAVALPLFQAASPCCVYFGSLALRHATSRSCITKLVAAMAPGTLRLADLNLRPVPGLQALAELALHLADWVKVNDEELQTLLRWFVCNGDEPPVPGTPAHDDALRLLTRRFAVQRWLVTQGPGGWFSVNSEGRRDASGPAEPVTALHDTVGAGDAFAAGVLWGYVSAWPLARSLHTANSLAAAACSWRGALAPDQDALERLRTRLR